MNSRTYAVIDIGSHSLRLMTGWHDGTQWHWSPKELATTRLGAGVSETRHLSPEGIAASLEAMAAWKQRLDGIPVCAVATSAVREAVDGQAFLAEIRARFGWHCRSISGMEEGALSFCGASSQLPLGSCAVVLDIGGGSSEVSVGVSGGSVSWSHSYPMGAVRFMKPLPISDEDVQDIEERCARLWRPMEQVPPVLIGVGGTLTTLAAMEHELTVYDPSVVNGTVISLEQLSARIHALRHMTPGELLHVPGLQPKRSAVIIPGLLIARSFLQHYGLQAVQISERDLMEGVFLRHSFHDAAWRAAER